MVNTFRRKYMSNDLGARACACLYLKRIPSKAVNILFGRAYIIISYAFY